MSGLGFYSVKVAAIMASATVQFLILAVFSFALGKLIPDDPSESILQSGLIILAYVAILTTAFYVARTQFAEIPRLFHGIAGFDVERLKEKEGAVLSGLALLLFAQPFTDRAFRVRDRLTALYK